MVTKIVTKEFRVSFPSVFKPRTNSNGKDTYSIQMLFPKTTDMTDIKELLKAAMVEKWPNADTRPKNLVNPLKDGDTDVMEDGTLRKEKYPELEGHWLLTASSMSKVGVVDQDVQPILDESVFYSGCYARASIHAYAYGPDAKNKTKKNGIGLGLNNVQKLRDGDSFNGRASAADDFDPVPVNKSNDAAVKETDDFLS